MRRDNRRRQKLDLPLPPTTRGADASTRAVAAEAASSPSSCLSSEAELGMRSSPVSPEATSSSMVLAGCSRCLMYVMLSEDDLKCPKCRSAVLLDFFHGTTTTNKNINKKSRMI